MAFILDFFKVTKLDKNTRRLAEEYLVKDLLGKNLKGKNKLKDLDSLDMEIKINKIIPSMIYTFQYNCKDDLVNLNVNDKCPIVFCTGYKQVNEYGRNTFHIYGINLNLMSELEKVKFLDFLVSTNENFYSSDIYNTNKVIVNNKLFSIIQTPNFAKIASNVLKFDITKYYRSYAFQGCKNFRVIEYNLWKYIPLYSPKTKIDNVSFEDTQKIVSKIFSK